MASKGQKYKKHNFDIKEIILSRYLNGESSVSLGKKFGISQNTIQIWGKKRKWPKKYSKLLKEQIYWLNCNDEKLYGRSIR